jgi:hypothetical protein
MVPSQDRSRLHPTWIYHRAFPTFDRLTLREVEPTGFELAVEFYHQAAVLVHVHTSSTLCGAIKFSLERNIKSWFPKES